MKRFVNTLISFFPPILAFGLEFVASFFAIGVMLFVLIYTSNLSYTTFYEVLSDQDFNAILSMIFSLSCIVVFGIWYYWKCEGNYTPAPSRTFRPSMLIAVVLMVPGAQFLSTILIAITDLINPAWLEYYMDLIESTGMTDGSAVLTAIYAVLLAPVGEELIFRGVTFRLARKAMPFWVANLFQAMLFGIFHMNVIQGVYAFALGILLGYVCERGGSIYYSILLHLVFNLWGTYFSELVDFGDKYAAYYAFYGIATVVFVFAIILFNRGRKALARDNAQRDAQMTQLAYDTPEYDVPEYEQPQMMQ